MNYPKNTSYQTPTMDESQVENNSNSYATETANGIKMWTNRLRQYHREDDLPALEYANGTKMWYKYGKLHRDNDLPAVIYSTGSKKWFKRGNIHREGGLPAIIWSDGKREWWVDGKHHRDDGPAVINYNGTELWFIHGKKVSESEFEEWRSKQENTPLIKACRD